MSGSEDFDLPEAPRPEDQLFLSGDPDWWHNACLNWAGDSWGLYVEGYRRSAELLIVHVEETHSDQDFVVYPALFLYRQYLELELKGIISDATALLQGTRERPAGHDISHLWSRAYGLLQQISPEEPVDDLNEVGRLIEEFSSLDPTGQGCRYPVDTRGNPSLPGISHMNLRNVREVMDRIALILGGAATQVGEYLSYKNEMDLR